MFTAMRLIFSDKITMFSEHNGKQLFMNIALEFILGINYTLKFDTKLTQLSQWCGISCNIFLKVVHKLKIDMYRN